MAPIFPKLIRNPQPAPETLAEPKAELESDQEFSDNQVELDLPAMEELPSEEVQTEEYLPSALPEVAMEEELPGDEWHDMESVSAGSEDSEELEALEEPLASAGAAGAAEATGDLRPRKPWYLQGWSWGVAALVLLVAAVVVDIQINFSGLHGSSTAKDSGKDLASNDTSQPTPVLVKRKPRPNVEGEGPVVVKLPSRVPEPMAEVPTETESESEPDPSPDPVAESPTEQVSDAGQGGFEAMDDAPYRDHSPEELLRDFLDASSLRERWPMMITESSPELLLESALDGPLPKGKRIELDYEDPHPEAGHTDHVFAVTMSGEDDREQAHRMVVRVRPDQSPKLLADPFLDLWGGRLADYASRPREEAADFDVVAVLLARSAGSDVPDPDGKMTLKLMGRDHEGEIARAYVDREGAFSQLLEADEVLLRFGSPTTCRVKLRWNTQEGRDKAWLEAVDITRFGWGPR
ncbi:MAG: hypothetical protein R3242_04835 [Akkermansiaceae bacterium]|nr:hypothetical protein [Akkermansiaceae bacterium]